MNNSAHYKRGFTVVEFTILIAIIVVLVAVGVPGFTASIRQRALAAAEYRVAGDLRQMLLLAVSQGGQARLHSGFDNTVNMVSSPGAGWQYRLERYTTGCNLAANWTGVSIWYDMATDVRSATLIGISDSTPTALIDIIFDIKGG